jgi:hypothetical protein
MRACVSVLASVLNCSTVLYGQLPDFTGTDFTRADSIAQLYPGHPLKDLKVLSDKLTSPLSTDVEKFRSVFKWVCLNVEIDYTLFAENKDKREKLGGEELAKWEKKFSTRVFSILAEHHRTVCTGYAYLVKELAFHAGLDCRIVNGYARHAQANIGGNGIINHSWNAIELEGKWYLCDPTWSSGIIDGERRAFIRKFDDAYFLASPSLFGRSHYPVDPQWILLENKPTLQTFLNAPLVYIGSFRYDVEPLAPTLFDMQIERGSSVTFRFTKGCGRKFSELAFYLENFRTTDAFTEEQDGSVTTYTVDHNFSHKGKYAVHILMDGNPVLSYRVRVN